MGLINVQFWLTVLAGILVSAGIVGVVAGIVGNPAGTAARRPDRRRPQEVLLCLGAFPLAGIVIGLLVLLLTRWPVAALGAGAVVGLWPRLFGGGDRGSIVQLEGLATWTESLRDTIAGAVGLEQAIPATAYAAAPSIAPQLRMMADRLRTRMPLPDALRRFADDLSDPSADLILSAMILNSRLRGPGLRDVLTSLAESAREDLDRRRRISADRASTRRSVQIVVGVSVLAAAALILFTPTYLQPYDGLLGQLVLVVVFAVFAAAFWWLRKLSVLEQPERFLVVRRDIS